MHVPYGFSYKVNDYVLLWIFTACLPIITIKTVLLTLRVTLSLFQNKKQLYHLWSYTINIFRQGTCIKRICNV